MPLCVHMCVCMPTCVCYGDFFAHECVLACMWTCGREFVRLKHLHIRVLPTVLLTPSASKAADMAHLCVPQNQALGVCRGFAPDIQICGTRGRKNLVNATIISNAEEEEEAYQGKKIHKDRMWLPLWLNKIKRPHMQTISCWEHRGRRRK